ncbi:putative disease resistance protein RGA3 [Trifolium repens]|nr:putative disease resistance protein RGA3 [Trifolium repens]
MTHSHVNESDVIGRENDKQKIIDLLLQDDGGDKSLTVIPIVGIGGLGKTTLAKCVFNDKSVVDQLQHHLRNTLAGHKFLLVLDDVWNEDRVKWEELKDIIQGVADTEGSKVLVTTRSHTVANVMGSTSPHILQGLSKKDSLSVFVKWAFKEGEVKNHPELMEIGKGVVQKCGGLPLALRTLGSSLFLKFDIEDWKFVRDNEIWNLPQKEDDILPAIKLSYDQLPSYLKPCFACFSLFEKDLEYSSFEVTVLWEALGFLPSPKKGQTIARVGNQLLHDLMSRSFLQDYIDHGNGCEFKLHDLVHDLALYVAKDEFQLVKLHGENIFENVLHLSFIENDLLGQTSVPTRLRTLIFPKGANNEAFLYTMMSRCNSLRILQIINSTYVSLPRSIGKLKHLRCLNLENNEELKSLPNSLCKLQNLHTLKLHGCRNLQTLPNGIGNMISLRQLYITTMQSNFPDKEIAKLTSLEFLMLESCDYLESLFEGIQLPNLNFLFVSSCGNLKSLPFHAIPKLENLVINDCDKMKLSLDHDSDISNLKLKMLALSSLPQLGSFPQWLQGCVTTLQSLLLRDCDNLDELPEWLSTLICLKTINIDNCSKLVLLPDDLHQLKNLEYLNIEGCPELCRRYHPKVGKDWHKISHIKQVIIESPEELED